MSVEFAEPQNMSQPEEHPVPKFNSEAVFWYTVQGISTILWSVSAYMVLKYLNTKTPAMRTVFDEIIKDTIYLNLLDWFVFVICVIAIEFLAPLNHYASLTLVVCRHTVEIIIIYQLSILVMIRYLYVFYTDQMNGAYYIRNLARCFVASVSIMSTVTLNLKNTPLYYFLTDKNFINENNNEPISFIIATAICWMSLTFTQCMIEKYNQSDVANLQQPENQTVCGKKCIKKIVKIIVFIFFSLSAFFISITIYTSLNTKVVYIKVLRITSVKDLIMHNVIPIIYIAGSDNLFSFVKNEFWEIIKLCKCRNNQIEPAMYELNVV